jgi:hypothetical protein
MSFTVCKDELYTGEVFTRTFTFTWVKLEDASLTLTSDHKILEVTLNGKTWKVNNKNTIIPNVKPFLNNGSNTLTVRTEWSIWDNMNPFTRANLSVTLNYKGVGLGFSLGWFERRWRELKEASPFMLIGMIALAIILIAIAYVVTILKPKIPVKVPAGG